MKHALKTLLILLLIVVMAIPAACEFKNANEIITLGGEQFGNDKETTDYSLDTIDSVLKDLIENYSGSYKNPTGTQIDDNGYDDMQDQIRKAQEDDDDQSATSSSGGGNNDGGKSVASSDNVASDEDLMRLFRTAYSDTSEYVTFTVSSGYAIGDIFERLDHIYRELQREDPIAIACVEAWTYGSYGSDYSIQISYSIDIPTLRQMKRDTPALVSAAVSSINTSGKSDYELVCAVNDYLCNTVYYPPNEPYEAVTHTPYGALNNGCAVCEGYACAAKLMLNQLGIECDIEIGECPGGGGHAWNLVKLDGNWYQMDVTWNDGGGDTTEYLLVTDDFMKKSRTWDYSNYPSTPSTPYTP